MNCDCIKEFETAIGNHMKPLAGDDATAKIQGTALNLVGNGLRYVLTIPFRVKGSKKGYTSEKGKEMPCNANYCPFCGRTTGRYVVGADDGISAAVNEWTARSCTQPTSQQ